MDLPSTESPGGNACKILCLPFFDFMELDWFTFSLPEEFAPQILMKRPDFPHRVKVSEYHHVILNLDGAGYQILFYRAFPWWLLFSFLACAVLKWYKAATMLPTGEAKREDIPLRGVMLASPKAFCKAIKKATLDPSAAVETDGGTLLFSGNRLREHMSIFGASGTGKSQFLLAFLSSFFAHKPPETRVIVVDRKGEFYAHFGTPQDVLFNPYDERSVKWSFFNELDIPVDFSEMPPDIKSIATILYPTAGHKDIFWPDSASSAFCAAAAYCVKAGKVTNKELVSLCNAKLSDVLEAFKTLPEGMPEKGVLAELPEETSGSILVHLKNGVKTLAACRDGDFSIRDWIRNGSGNLFLSSAGKNDTAFMLILSLLIDLIGREVKELPDSGVGGVKYLFVIDELAAYPKMNTLHFLVAEARSKGVAVIVATQTIQKVFNVYGERDGKDILGNTKGKVIFRTIEAHNAEYLARTIGATEKERTTHARNENASTVLGRIDSRAGETTTKQIVSETVFLPSELSTLETGNAVVIHPCAGSFVSKLRFAPFKGEKRGIEFEPIHEKTVSAREFAEIEKRRLAEEAAKKKSEEEKKKAEEARRAAEAKKKREQEEREGIEILKQKIANGELNEEDGSEDGSEGYLL